MRIIHLLPLTLLLATQGQAGLDASLALVSDYLYRGWSQTQGKPTLQADLSWSLPAGLYLDAWGSGVDFGEGGSHPARVEADLTAGFAGGDEEGLAWDFSVFRCQYPGSSSDFNYNEAVLSLSRRGLGLEAAWSPDEFAGGSEGGHLGLTLERALGEAWSLKAGAGCALWSRPASRSLFDEDRAAWALDGSLALGRTLWGLDWELGLHATDGRGKRLADGQGGARVVLQASRALTRSE